MKDGLSGKTGLVTGTPQGRRAAQGQLRGWSGGARPRGGPTQDGPAGRAEGWCQKPAPPGPRTRGCSHEAPRLAMTPGECHCRWLHPHSWIWCCVTPWLLSPCPETSTPAQRGLPGFPLLPPGRAMLQFWAHASRGPAATFPRCPPQPGLEGRTLTLGVAPELPSYDCSQEAGHPGLSTVVAHGALCFGDPGSKQRPQHKQTLAQAGLGVSVLLCRHGRG